jgi:sugar-specific transcriptional regulator TrmB
MELAAIVEKLDLNSYEKAAVLFLASVKSASAKDIIRHARIPQGRIYSVLNNLRERSIVSIIPTSPKQYMIDDVKKALHLYLERAKVSIAEQQESLKHAEIIPRAFPKLKTPSSVLLFTGREEHLNALMAMRHQAKQELLQIAPLFVGSFASNLSLHKALARGIKAKIIIRDVSNENMKAVQQAIKEGAEIRKSRSTDLLSMVIRDDEEYMLGVQDYRNHEERLNIVGRNKALLQALHSQFMIEWKKAKPVTIR